MIPIPVSIDAVEMDDYGNECFQLNPSVFRKLTGPGVYIAVAGSQAKPEVLYVGSAKNILARISEALHTSLRKAFKRPDCHLLIMICKSERHARGIETEFIWKFNPSLNVAKPTLLAKKISTSPPSR